MSRISRLQGLKNGYQQAKYEKNGLSS